jgi:hypothetical protein
VQRLLCFYLEFPVVVLDVQRGGGHIRFVPDQYARQLLRVEGTLHLRLLRLGRMRSVKSVSSLSMRSKLSSFSKENTNIMPWTEE